MSHASASDQAGHMTFGGPRCAYLQHAPAGVPTSGDLAPLPTKPPRTKHVSHTSTVLSIQVIDEDEPAVTAPPIAYTPRTSTHGCEHMFAWVPVTRQMYWEIALADVTLSYPGHVNHMRGPSICGSASCPSTALVDSGTYLMYAPSSFLPATGWKDLTGCRDLTVLPTIHFHIDAVDPTTGQKLAKRVMLSLTPADYVLSYVIPDEPRECVVGITPDDVGVTRNGWTLGQVLLRSYYTVFDRDTNRVGFARLPQGKRE